MPYTSNADLPEAVRNALPAAAQSIFRNVFNAQAERGLSEERAFASAWGALKNQGWEKGDDGKWHKVEKALYLEIVRKDADQRRVFGYGSVAVSKTGEAVVDLQGDIIEVAELEEAVYDYVLDSRVGGEMHTGDAPSRLIESVIFTPEKLAKMGIPEGVVPLGWWCGFQVTPETFAKVKDGSRLMFSVEGSGVREPTE